MIGQLKAYLYRVLGRDQYLRLVSQLFFLAYRSGVLRYFSSFQCHYYVRRFIQPGDYIIDIGANLGYYTVLFAEWTGEEGKVYSVEPILPYRKVLWRHTHHFSQVEIIPYALGGSSETVRMGIPGADRYRHGLSRILSPEETQATRQTFEAEVRPPDALFAEVPRLDYVKCDVEGFEREILPAMQDLLQRHRPILQVEVKAENRSFIYEMMNQLGYEAYFVEDWELVPIRDADQRTRGDWIFRPTS